MKKVISETNENRASHDDAVKSPAPTAPSLDQILNSINIDCRVAPEEYIEDVDIPGGGE